MSGGRRSRLLDAFDERKGRKNAVDHEAGLGQLEQFVIVGQGSLVAGGVEKLEYLVLDPEHGQGEIAYCRRIANKFAVGAEQPVERRVGIGGLPSGRQQMPEAFDAVGMNAVEGDVGLFPDEI